MSRVAPFPVAFPSSKTFPTDASASRWRQLYECAILELDHSKLPGRITEARHAILEQGRGNIDPPRSCEEHQALNTALRALRLLEEVAVKQAQLPKSIVARFPAGG